MQLTAEDGALVRRAAEAEGADLANFIVTGALARARDVLAGRRVFALDDADWKAFMQVLDRRVSVNPRLAELFVEPSVFAGE